MPVDDIDDIDDIDDVDDVDDVDKGALKTAPPVLVPFNAPPLPPLPLPLPPPLPPWPPLDDCDDQASWTKFPMHSYTNVSVIRIVLELATLSRDSIAWIAGRIPSNHVPVTAQPPEASPKVVPLAKPLKLKERREKREERRERREDREIPRDTKRSERDTERTK